MSLINSRGLVFPSNLRESAERSTSISSCDEPTTPPAHMDGLSSPSCTLVSDSSHLSVSLLYPDTAPRSAWRPQIDAWMRRHHPSDLKRIATMADVSSRAMPYKLPLSRSSVPSPPPEQLSPAPPVPAASASCETPKTASDVAQESPVSPKSSKAPLSPQYTPLFVESSAYAPPPGVVSPIPPPVRPLSGSFDAHAASYSPAASSIDSRVESPTFAAVPAVQPAQPPTPAPQYQKLSSAAPRTLLSPPASPPMPNDVQKTCISCSCSQSPCWRPSWSPSAGQLCNSCGLRYKKTGARCINASCGKIPSKGEWNHMIRAASTDVYGNTVYSCLQCRGPVALRS